MQQISSEVLDSSILALLEDVNKHPKSRIAARYKRLNILVRQGQKLKTEAINQGLMKAHLETTETGRLKTISLTERV